MPQKTVLVVEDEAVLRHILEQKLSKEQYGVLSAADGLEALSIAIEKKPDLILLDVMMPHDGITMLQQLRQNEPYGKRALVILLTNLSPDDESIIASIDKYEPAFYLVKANYTLEQLVNKVEEALKKNS